MGLRAASIKKYEIEYGTHRAFNYDAETLTNIIKDYCDDFYNGDDGFGGYTTDVIWEIDKEEFVNMTNELEQMPEEEFKERMRDEWKAGEETDATYSKEYVLNFFKGCIEDTPSDSLYVRIGWL